MNDTPNDFGAHHRLRSSGVVHASNTMRAGPLKVRVTTSSRSDVRSTVVWFFMRVGSLSLLASIDLLLPFQFLDNLVQLVEACVPELAVPLEPCRLFLQSGQAELAGSHAPDFLRHDEPRLLQNADMLLHAGEGHVELPGKVRDGSVCTPELLQNAASGGVRECRERGIEAGLEILNHVVRYLPHGLAACKGRPIAAALPAAVTPQNRPHFDADSIDWAIPGLEQLHENTALEVEGGNRRRSTRPRSETSRNFFRSTSRQIRRDAPCSRRCW